MWKLGLAPRNSFLGIFVSNFRYCVFAVLAFSSHICTVDNIELRVFCYTVKMYQLCNIVNKILLLLKQSLEKF
jgi:hypothetical protein